MPGDDRVRPRFHSSSGKNRLSKEVHNKLRGGIPESPCRGAFQPTSSPLWDRFRSVLALFIALFRFGW